MRTSVFAECPTLRANGKRARSASYYFFVLYFILVFYYNLPLFKSCGKGTPMKSMRHAFDECEDVSQLVPDMVRSNRAGVPVGIFSICSANRFVLEAGMMQADADHTVLCIESTSNQVNQFGGYTGMKPAEFGRFVESAAAGMGFSRERIILGGDHLGPHVWRNEPARMAMSKARDLVRECVLAGYTKIHLDASMRCADDPGDNRIPPSDEVVTERVVDLCRIAEAAHAELPSGSAPPLYVIGTEVPPPGGERQQAAGPAVTSIEDAKRTLTLAHGAFLSRGLQAAWSRVIAMVVQPGVDFGDSGIWEYDREKASHLSSCIEKNCNLVFEAHSTDYQPRRALKQMVQDHFAILKVGPWLTFAFREAVFALAEMEAAWLSDRKSVSLSRVREALERAMLEDTAHWEEYYHGDNADLRFARQYSYCDRSRYYWTRPEPEKAFQILVGNLSERPVPLTLLSQYMPVQYQAVRERRIKNTPGDLIHNKILEVLDIYASACGMR
jgi:D-tagatose-1,6-bisphosphate aldolase subunit GatZ/KbaZ